MQLLPGAWVFSIAPGASEHFFNDLALARRVLPVLRRITMNLCAQTAGRTTRNLDLDAARGFMLVWMTLTHLPTALTPWVNQPFGYVSSSQGFILLSALFTGRIYTRMLSSAGAAPMARKLLSRTFKLYVWHLGLLFGVFIIAGHYAIAVRGGSLHNLLDFYFAAGPARAIRDSILLIYRPPLLDILPLYIIFLLISPAVLLAATRIGWKVILVSSFALWLAAQFGLREAAYGFLVRHSGLRVPLAEMGAFNLWGWQFLWMAGLCGGALWAANAFPAAKWADRAWKPAAVVAAAFVILRYLEIAGVNVGSSGFLFDKWNLGAMRLVNLAAAGIVLVRFRYTLSRFAVRPLVEMGQASLRVFCAHFACCFVGIGMMGNADRIFGWRQAVLVAGTFAVLWAIARFSRRPELEVVARNATNSGTVTLSAHPTLGRHAFTSLTLGGPFANGHTEGFSLYNSGNPVGIKTHPHGAQSAPALWREYEDAENSCR